MKLFTGLSCGLLLLPLTVLAADPFNYDYVEVNYQHQSLQNGSDATANGPGLEASYTIWNQLQIIGGYAHLDTSAPISDITNDNSYVGIRGESTYSDSTDFYTDILYLNNHSSYQGNSNNDDGYRVALGMRHLFNRWIEFDGSVGHNSLTQSSNDASVGLWVYATSWLSVGVDYTRNAVTSNTSRLLVRAYF
ncbi:MAG: hypothetical protein ACRETA_10035 [Gammaproteobacteria bacterium]